VPPHDRESTMDRESAVVPSSIDPIYDFSIKKQFQEITPTFFKLAIELYRNQFREIPENVKTAGKPLDFLISL
jgi:hypothetical protein